MVMASKTGNGKMDFSRQQKDGAQWVPEFLVWSDDMTAVVSQLPRQGLRFSGEAVRVALAQGGDGEMKVMADLVGTSCLFLHHRKVRGRGRDKGEEGKGGEQITTHDARIFFFFGRGHASHTALLALFARSPRDTCCDFEYCH